jgi:hypothetical protein
MQEDQRAGRDHREDDSDGEDPAQAGHYAAGGTSDART